MRVGGGGWDRLAAAMRLKRYEVRGFKNLTAPVVLDELGAINVIHGENNVGKSNVLQSMEWLFDLLGSGLTLDEKNPWWNFVVPIADGSAFRKRFEDEQIFNLRSPAPIRWQVTFEIEPGDLEAAGVEPREGFEQGLRAELVNEGARHVFSASLLSEHPAFSGAQVNRLRGLIARGFGSSARRLSAFALVDTRRRSRTDPNEPMQSRNDVVPQGQMEQLFDAREAFEPQQRAPWESFQRAMESLTQALDGGKILVSYNRQSHEARMLWERGETRIPVTLLGSGFQQVIALVARLANSNSPIVAVEEPELNLRYALQLILRDVFEALVGSERGVRQLFLTSHSPAFESGDHFYWMAPGPGGPTIEKRPVRDAAHATAMPGALVAPAGSAPTSYVTSEGLTRVPEPVISALGLGGGGVVYFHRAEADAPYQFLTEEQFFALWPKEPDTESTE